MADAYFEDQEFLKLDHTGTALQKGTYEYCSFKQCNFSNSSLADILFIECDFIQCNLSLATLYRTDFRGVRFTDCKMLGLHFEDCNKYGLQFSCNGCTLHNATFYESQLKQLHFHNTELNEADFTNADISGSIFSACNFNGAKFSNTNLEKTDLRTSINFAINPLENRIKKAKFSKSELEGLLHSFDIIVDAKS